MQDSRSYDTRPRGCSCRSTSFPSSPFALSVLCIRQIGPLFQLSGRCSSFQSLLVPQPPFTASGRRSSRVVCGFRCPPEQALVAGSCITCALVLRVHIIARLKSAGVTLKLVSVSRGVSRRAATSASDSNAKLARPSDNLVVASLVRLLVCPRNLGPPSASVVA